MTETDVTRPAGEVPGRGATQMEGLRAGLFGETLAEFLGTLVLIAFGDGVVAMAVAALNQSGRGPDIFLASGDWLLITWGWAVAVTLAIYVAGGVTGAHINPAVTLAFAVRGDFPWRKVPWYWVAQVAGAFVGAAVVYLVYHDAISSFEAAKKITRGAANSVTTFSIFATFPAPYFHGNWVGPLIDQIVGTAFLLMFVAALTDRRNLAPLGNLTPWLVGLAVARRSACPTAPTPATRSTPRATSAHGSSPPSRAGATWRCPATAPASAGTSGSRSSVRSSAGCSAS